MGKLHSLPRRLFYSHTVRFLCPDGRTNVWTKKVPYCIILRNLHELARFCIPARFMLEFFILFRLLSGEAGDIFSREEAAQQRTSVSITSPGVLAKPAFS